MIGEWTFYQNNAPIYTDFLFDNCLPQTGTWTAAKRNRRNLNWIEWKKSEEQREQAKSGFKIVFLGVDRDKSDESAFLGRRAGQRVSVSKSGLSRRDRDGWQVCTCCCYSFKKNSGVYKNYYDCANTSTPTPRLLCINFPFIPILFDPSLIVACSHIRRWLQ